MNFRQRAFGLVQALAVILSLAMPLVVMASSADARVGGGSSSGSRGARTFSAPPSTSTAPNAAQPFNRTITQPGSPNVGTPRWRFLQPAGHGPVRRTGRGISRRRSSRHAVWRRNVRRHRRIIVDHRPDVADRHHRVRWCALPCRGGSAVTRPRRPMPGGPSPLGAQATLSLGNERLRPRIGQRAGSDSARRL